MVGPHGFSVLVIAGMLATLASSLFAGAAIYISLVEHPARLACGTELAARQFAPSYRRATVMQAMLAVTATLAGATQWFTGYGGGDPLMDQGRALWLLGALIIGSVIPFTLVVIYPTNRKLLEPGRDSGSEETRHLLEAWGRLHAVRGALSLAATLVFLYALVGS